MIAVEGLSIRQGHFALENVTFTIPTGSYAVLMGPTGCGKTTLLECVAGLRCPTAGRIVLGDRDVTALPPAVRDVGYVPQDAAVFAHLSVRENLAFALTVRRTPRAEIAGRVSELAERLGLSELLNRRAVGLSGGEAQRVALGRALAFRPPVLLLDEPLNAVDAGTRERLMEVLLDLKGKLTVLHVTHTAAEAEHLADQVLHFDGGKVRPAIAQPTS
jgi:molybdate/tungstate transport system ATP-binding protein